MATKKKKKGSASASRQPAKKKSAPKGAAKKKAAPKGKASALKSKAVKRSAAKPAPAVERSTRSAADDGDNELEHSQAALDLVRAAKQAALARLLRR